MRLCATSRSPKEACASVVGPLKKSPYDSRFIISASSTQCGAYVITETFTGERLCVGRRRAKVLTGSEGRSAKFHHAPIPDAFPLICEPNKLTGGAHRDPLSIIEKL